MNLKEAIKKTVKALWMMMPVLAGIVLLVSVASVIFKPEIYARIFTGSFADSIIGSFLGSILAGNPITSYIVGGELLEQGVSLMAVTAFIVAWVTVGLVQLPAESILLGKRFAITRNVLSFFMAIIIAILVVVIIWNEVKKVESLYTSF